MNQTMTSKKLSIGAVANLTGVPQHTLRKWESRHGIGIPDRTTTGRRVYRQETVEQLRLIKSLLSKGHSLAHLTERSVAELKAIEEAEAKETVKEYKNMAKADMSGGDDKSAKSPVASKGGAAPKASPVKMGSGADETGRPAPTAKSMNATTEPKMKEVKADTKDGSDKSAKSPVAKS